MIELDMLDRASHDSWSDRDRLPREPVHKLQRLRIFADHLPHDGQEYDCTLFRVDPKGALLLQDRGEMVCAFAPGFWSSFEAVEIVDPEANSDG